MNECCKKIAKEIFGEIEKEPRGLGLEKLAREHPDFVSWITYNYQDWQKIKEKFLGNFSCQENSKKEFSLKEKFLGDDADG